MYRIIDVRSDGSIIAELDIGIVNVDSMSELEELDTDLPHKVADRNAIDIK